MCDHAADPAAPDAAAPRGALNALLPKGSRRRRLWDLPAQCHCPVVGVCLPLAALRQIAARTLGGTVQAGDYELHVGAVAECACRNRLSEALQRALEQRHARAIAHFKTARDRQTLAQRWAEAVDQGEVAGAFWAALTHPHCDAALQDAICRTMHMLQHQAGAGARADLARRHALQSENALLMRELGRAQERSTRMMAEKSAELERAQAALAHARAESIARERATAELRAELAQLKASVSELDTRTRLQKELGRVAERQRDFSARIAMLRQKLAATRAPHAGADAPAAEPASVQPVPPAASAGAPQPVQPLQQKIILCVGGRSGSIAGYRDIVERTGGRFAHHDGGIEDKPNALDASLAAADLVICQTACISHNAYWKVKDFCKRTGKRCVYVENPSASSLARSLAQVAGGAEPQVQN